MPVTCPKSIIVTFSGITFDDTIGFDQDVNQSYQIKWNSHGGHGQYGCTYLYNATVNGVYVMVEVTTSTGGNTIIYDLTPVSDINHTFHVFEGGDANALPGGGTATIA